MPALSERQIADGDEPIERGGQSCWRLGGLGGGARVRERQHGSLGHRDRSDETFGSVSRLGRRRYDGARWHHRRAPPHGPARWLCDRDRWDTRSRQHGRNRIDGRPCAQPSRQRLCVDRSLSRREASDLIPRPGSSRQHARELEQIRRHRLRGDGEFLQAVRREPRREQW